MAESQEHKTFKTDCPHCKQPFTVRFPLADPKAEGTSDVAVECMYCERTVMIKIPTKYVGGVTMIRSYTPPNPT